MVLAVALGGCASSGSDMVVILAASSTAPAVEAAASALDMPVAVTSGGSQVLVAQVRGGAPADLVLLADRALADDLVLEGFSAPIPLMTSGVSLVGRPGLDVTDAGAALADARLTLVLADVGVPLGDATAAALAALGVTVAADRIVSLEDAASSVLAKVTSGAADLAVVYTANAVVAARDGRATDLGTLASDEVTVTTWVQSATPAGEAFLARLGGDIARDVLRTFGFTPS